MHMEDKIEAAMFRLLLLRRCSQGVLFADLLLGCAQALHVVAKAVRQDDRG